VANSKTNASCFRLRDLEFTVYLHSHAGFEHMIMCSTDLVQLPEWTLDRKRI